MNYKRVKKIFMNDGTAGVEDSSSFDNDDDASSQVFIIVHNWIKIPKIA
jgi:hypothetical protein